MVTLGPFSEAEPGRANDPPATAGPGLVPSILFERGASSQTALVCADSGASLSYADLARSAADLAWALRLQSFRPRDRAAILLPTSVEFAAAFFGALAAGLVVIPFDIHLKRADLIKIIEWVGPRVLFTSPGLYRKIGTGLGNVTVGLLEWRNGLTARFAVPAQSVEERHESQPRTANQGGDGNAPAADALTPEDDAVYILSSGTTGLPKVVRLSHRAVMENIRMHWESLEIGEAVRGLQLLPVNYSYGLNASFLSLLRSGGTVVLLPGADPRGVQAALDRFDVNLVMGTPALFQYLIEQSPAPSDLARSPVRYLTVGGDRCKRYVLDLIRSKLPSARTYLTYGLTEAGPRVSTLPPDLAHVLPESVGLPLKGVEVFIQDHAGRRRPARETGEIVLRTPSLMNGYLGDTERTRTVIRDGLCHTGDLGYLDDRGFLYYLGRRDRQFKVGGRLVNPSLIERCLAAHPGVKEVRVMKVENERDESICASIRTADTRREELTAELRRLCLREMPSYLVPREFRFEKNNHYYHKGRILNPAREPLPGETETEGPGSLPGRPAAAPG